MCDCFLQGGRIFVRNLISISQKELASYILRPTKEISKDT